MKVYTTLILVSLLGATIPAQVTHADEYSWQMAQLFEPDRTRVQSEKRGQILIYQGLKDVDVNRAMDDQYDRIEYMMFTRTVVTDTDGQPVNDPDSGEVVVEEDGC